MKSKTKVDSLIKRNCVDGIAILSAAIGYDAFDSFCLLKRAKQSDEVLDQLGYVHDPQYEIEILQFCLCALEMVLSLRRNSHSEK